MSDDRNDQVDVDFSLMEFTKAKGRQEMSNLAKLLINNIQVKIAGKTVHTATEEGCLGVYKDLWKSEEEREDMICYGIADEDT